MTQRIHHAPNNAQIFFAARRAVLPAGTQPDVTANFQPGLCQYVVVADTDVTGARIQENSFEGVPTGYRKGLATPT